MIKNENERPKKNKLKDTKKIKNRKWKRRMNARVCEWVSLCVQERVYVSECVYDRKTLVGCLVDGF